MRISVALFAIALEALDAMACPGQDADISGTSTPSAWCLSTDWGQVRRSFEIRYAVGAGGATRTGLGASANAYATLELGSAWQFGGDPAQPSYEIEVSAGATGARSTGALDTNALTTRAALRLGPARLPPSIIDTGRGNIAPFPLTLELAHAGELGARPRLGARPELARAMYDRQRVELATRAVRIEAAGTTVAQTTAPGTVAPAEAASYAVDAFPVRASIDLARQDGMRVDTRVSGAMVGIVDHARGALAIIDVEYRHVDVAPVAPIELFTLWFFRYDVVDHRTQTAYSVGWGQTMFRQAVDLAASFGDDGSPMVGGVGLFTHRAWGGLGFQYRRDLYVASTGDIGLEDRVSGELSLPALLGGVLRGFTARTSRLVDDKPVHDVTAGVEVAASYERAGVRAQLGLELGRTFYTALDDTLPTTTGFVTQLGLTLQHAGRHAW